jgi:transcriptional regulator of acetoin/glycerol metabolism
VFNKKFNKEIEGISNDFLEKFMEYSWPGNIRELEHSIEHAFVLCNQNVITLNHLPNKLEELSGIMKPFHEGAEATERTRIIQALERISWNKAETARQLGMSRRNLYRKIKDYNIKILYNVK